MMTMMMMKDQEESTFVCEDQLQVIKGKRSKRPRQPSPLSLAMCSGTTMPMMGMISTDESRGFDPAVASPTTSVESDESTEEDADMANCLILLARGGQTRKFPPLPDVHQCKTCYRSFPSFQALGGHRASHKKPKVVNNEENNKGLYANAHPSLNNNMNTTLSLQVTNNNKVPKVHECSMCGAEFSSGQALGGHMRRHRTLTNVATTTTTSVGTRIVRPELSEDKSKKQRTLLQLDLNLPAPEDDHLSEITQFSFASKQEKLLLFSASSLVDFPY